MKTNGGRIGRVMGLLGVACLDLLVCLGVCCQPTQSSLPQMAQERANLKGHTDSVTSLAFNPDGKTLASGSRDGTIKLWDVRTGKEETTIKTYTSWVLSVAYSPDGKTLASGKAGTGPKEIKLWDVATGKERATLKGHTDSVNSVYTVGCLAFSPDGKTLASSNDEPGPLLYPTLTLWDVATGGERATLKGHTNVVHSVAYSPDGKTLASGGDDKTIKLWDMAKGK